jgi:hypothetical protein
MEITVETSAPTSQGQRPADGWADHLAKAVEAEIRRGSHQLLLIRRSSSQLSGHRSCEYSRQLREIRGPCYFAGPDGEKFWKFGLTGMLFW